MEFKTEKINLLREFLVTQMNHWMLSPIYFSTVVFILDVAGITAAPHILLWLVFGLLPFFLYLERSAIKKNWITAMLHAAAIPLCLFIPAEHIMIRLFYLLVGIGYVVYSVYLWIGTDHRQDDKIYPVVAVGLSLVMLYLQHNLGHEEWDVCYIVSLIAVLALYFVIYYIEQYLNFLVVNNSSAGHIPAGEIFHSGMGLVLGYTGIGILILFVTSSGSWMRGFLQIVKNFMISIVRLFFSLFPENTQQITEEIAMEDTVEIEEMSLLEGGETFWLWNFVQYLIEIVILIVIVFSLIKGIIFLVKFIRSRLGRLRTEQEISDGPIVDVREKCDITQHRERKTVFSFLKLNAKERIRHLYKKRLLSSSSLFPSGGDVRRLDRYTARESGRILEKNELAAIYEKARYSDETCDSEDVRHMKNACK